MGTKYSTYTYIHTPGANGKCPVNTYKSMKTFYLMQKNVGGKEINSFFQN